MVSYWLPLQQVAVSRWLRSKVGRKAVRVIPNGVDLDMFRPNPVIGEKHSKFTIGTIGSEATAKGYRVFVDSIAHIPESLISAARVLVACHEKVALPKRIEAELIAPQNDVQLIAFYQQCDVFVFSSVVEGFGLPPIEAMACGVPVVVSDCGGVREFVNEQNAIIVPVDNAAAIAAAVTLLFHDTNRRMELRSLGLATAKEFSARAMLGEYKTLVEAP
jgi:glycosyltransferase involved in cell wall biosynthesis